MANDFFRQNTSETVATLVLYRLSCLPVLVTIQFVVNGLNIRTLSHGTSRP